MVLKVWQSGPVHLAIRWTKKPETFAGRSRILAIDTRRLLADDEEQRSELLLTAYSRIRGLIIQAKEPVPWQEADEYVHERMIAVRKKILMEK